MMFGGFERHIDYSRGLETGIPVLAGDTGFRLLGLDGFFVFALFLLLVLARWLSPVS